MAASGMFFYLWMLPKTSPGVPLQAGGLAGGLAGVLARGLAGGFAKGVSGGLARVHLNTYVQSWLWCLRVARQFSCHGSDCVLVLVSRADSDA